MDFLFAYSVVFFSAIVSLIWHVKVYDVILLASCKLGALFTLFTLLTGAIWGKPMWGTWWAWDARLTSELILSFYIFRYYFYMALSRIKESCFRSKYFSYNWFYKYPNHTFLCRMVEHAPSGPICN